MFKNCRKSHGKINVQGLVAHLPKKPGQLSIEGFHKKTLSQKWRRTELPGFKASDIDILSGEVYAPDEILSWDQVRREELIGQSGVDPWSNKKVSSAIGDPYYINPYLEEFRQQEYDRIEKGYWFFNKGHATYITGFNYFYLNWWKLNTGYPDFRVTDMEVFYFWQVVLENPDLYGLLEITRRGQGKSYRMGSVAYLQTIRHQKAHVGIQSKTDEDAEEFFDQKVVEPYKSLPEFLVPIHNHGSEPQKRLNFFPPADRSNTGQFKIKSSGPQPLRSFMSFRNAKERAYDGTTLKFLVQDEIAKLEPKIGNAQKRLGINRNCVYRDSRMVGKIWCSTTVEDMDKGGENTKRIWYDSDYRQLSGIGRTKSGIVRFFTSAIDSSYFDPYGFPMRAKAKKEHDAERENKQGDSVEYIGYVQRNPYNIEEAFMSMGRECIYNAEILQNRQSFLQEFKMTVRGDFIWENGIRDTKAEFVPNKENGKWEVSWRFADKGEENNVSIEVGIMNERSYSPKNDSDFGFAFDPYSHMKVVDENRRSNAGGAIYRDYNPWVDPDQSDTFIADYLARPDDPEESYEDMVIACHYFSCSILIENNKNDAIRYFYRRGYGDFIMQRPPATLTSSTKPTDGIPSNINTIEYYIKRMKSHVVQHGRKLQHLRIVRDLLEFDPKHRTKFDLGVASQLALVANEKHKYDIDQIDQDTNVDEIFGFAG